MPTPLEDIKYLANSAHRVQVLYRLAKSPTDRRTLLAELDISPPTMSRVLAGMLDRGWIRRADAEYKLSPSGKQLATDFAELESNLERSQKLQLIEDLLPTSELGVDLDYFQDATIITPTSSAPSRHVARPNQLLVESQAVRGIAVGVIPESVQASHSAVTTNNQSLELFVTPEVVEVVRSDASMVAAVREILSASNAKLFMYHGAVSCGVFVMDDVVVLGPSSKGGLPGVVLAENGELLEWAHGFIDDCADESTPLRTTDFPDRSA